MPTTWRQDGFRFRNDDGNELVATWIDALNANISKNITYGSVNVRVRIAASEQGSTAAALTGRLYVSKNGGAYAQVSEISTNGLKAINSANLTDDEATTQQISSVTWVAGKADDINGQCSATGSIARYSGTEHEYMIQLDCTHLING
ncbi:MAG: hypothetical protein MUO42_12470, partial [Anaerolineaceae bacterium]|nr:hypothetical protein [Anaerolineaceae bacterium]